MAYLDSTGKIVTPPRSISVVMSGGKRKVKEHIVKEGEEEYPKAVEWWMFVHGYFPLEEKKEGGPGSGHFGHAGRPGKRGGSLPGKGKIFPFAKTQLKDVVWERMHQTSGKQRSYIYTPEGEYLDVHDHGGPSTYSHLALKEVYPEINGQYGGDIVLAGGIQVRENYRSGGDWTSIETSHLDTQTLKKLQKLDASGKVQITGSFNWAAFHDGRARWITASYEDFISASSVLVRTGNFGVTEVSLREGKKILARQRISAGGPGSGHFGHAGRPGKRGGSAPGKKSSLGPNLTEREKYNPDPEHWVEDDKMLWAPDGKFIQNTEGMLFHSQIAARVIVGDPDSYESVIVEEAKIIIDWDTMEAPLLEMKVHEKGFVSIEREFVSNGITLVSSDSKPERYATSTEFNSLFQRTKKGIKRGNLKVGGKPPPWIGIHYNRSYYGIGLEGFDTISGFTIDREGRPVPHFKDAKRLTLRSLKRVLTGGPGSGFFGHAGRPGLRGGSAPRGADKGGGGLGGELSPRGDAKTEAGIGPLTDYPQPQRQVVIEQMEKFKTEYADDLVEHGVLINDGGWTIEVTGDEESLEFDLTLMDQMRFGGGRSVFIHNHPLGIPHSPEDYATAARLDLKTMVVVGVRKTDGLKVAYTMGRPSGGWHDWKDTHHVMKKYMSVDDIMTYESREEMFGEDYAEYWTWTDIWSRVAEGEGIIYREEVIE